MQFEMGEISAEEFAGIERTVIDRLREIRADREGGGPALGEEGVRISGIEISGPDADVDVDMPAIDVAPSSPSVAAAASAYAPAPRKRAAARKAASRKSASPKTASPTAAAGRRRARR
jgi:hypothetical protein